MDKAHLITYLIGLASIIGVLIICCLLYLCKDELNKLFSKDTELKLKKFLKENVKLSRCDASLSSVESSSMSRVTHPVYSYLPYNIYYEHH